MARPLNKHKRVCTYYSVEYTPKRIGHTEVGHEYIGECQTHTGKSARGGSEKLPGGESDIHLGTGTSEESRGEEAGPTDLSLSSLFLALSLSFSFSLSSFRFLIC